MKSLRKYLTYTAFLIGIAFVVILAGVTDNMKNLSNLINNGEVANKISSIDWHKTMDRSELYSVTYGNGTYVAVGTNGVIKISTDGDKWTVIDNYPIWLKGVVWGKDRFVSIGSLGTILTSKDGKTWLSAQSGVNTNLESITWNGNMYVAVGEKGIIVTSEDGITWTKRSLEVPYNFSKIVCSSNKFIACISDTFNVVLESDDGVNWYTVTPYGNHYGYYNAAYNGTTFIMSGKIPNQEGFVTITSKNGINWTQVGNPPLITSITSNGRSFIATGNSTRDENNIVTQYIYASEDGVDWRTHQVKWDAGLFRDIRDIYWCNDRYIGLKYTGEIYTSLDALQWRQASTDIPYTFEKIIWNGNNVMAYDKSGRTLLSNDGRSWTESTTLNIDKPIINMLHAGDKTFAIAGSPAKMFISADGVNWKKHDMEGLEYSKVLWTGNNFILFTNTELYTSSDAITWTKIQKPANFIINSIVWDGKKYVAVGGQSTIYGGESNYSQPFRCIGTSIDGVNWTIDKFEGATSLNEIIWVNNQFIAIGDGGTVLTSENGQTDWIRRISHSKNNLADIVWDGKKYIILGGKGTILYSMDGRAWIDEKTNLTSDYISQLVSSNDRYIGLGLNSIIIGTSSINSTLEGGIAPKNKFIDVRNHWARDYIIELRMRNAINGVNDSTFAPNRDITRAEFATIIVRALELDEVTKENLFSDVKESDWYFKTMSTAYDKGIITGYGNGEVRPKNLITREEAMTMINRALKVAGREITITDAEIATLLSRFRDKSAISDWAKSSTAICIKNKIVQGSEGLLRPNNNITRAETATIVMNMLQ